jgi:hypothetical protein
VPGVRATSAAAVASARRRRSIHGASSLTASSAAFSGARRGSVTDTAPSPSTLTRTRRARGDLRRLYSVTGAMMATMADWTVQLPPSVREPYEVFINGVRQEPGRDFQVRGRTLIFDRPLQKEGKLGFWRWFWGAWGIGTYRKNDQVDVTWFVNGRPRVAHALDIEPPSDRVARST